MILDKDTRIKTKILKAIMEDPEIVLLLKEKYVDDEIWKFCIEREPSLFRRMKHPSEEIGIYACSVDGSNLKYIRNKFHHILINGSLCFLSVRSNPRAILYVPRKFLTEELKELAFDGDPSMMTYFDNISDSYVRKIINEKPYAVKYIRKLNEATVCEAIRKSPSICPYLNQMTDRMVAVLANNHPEYFNLYKNNIVINNNLRGEE